MQPICQHQLPTVGPSVLCSSAQPISSICKLQTLHHALHNEPAKTMKINLLCSAENTILTTNDSVVPGQFGAGQFGADNSARTIRRWTIRRDNSSRTIR